MNGPIKTLVRQNRLVVNNTNIKLTTRYTLFNAVGSVGDAHIEWTTMYRDFYFRIKNICIIIMMSGGEYVSRPSQCYSVDQNKQSQRTTEYYMGVYIL